MLIIVQLLCLLLHSAAALNTARNLSAALSSRYFSSTAGSTPFKLRSNTSWPVLFEDLNRLNNETNDRLSRLIIFGRHGEGVHNVAERKYGREAWDEKWSMLNGDEQLTWGPDARLTSVGREQALTIQRAWSDESEMGLQWPSRKYSSPLRRSLQTAQLTFNLTSTSRGTLTVLEGLREKIGVHTCDQRVSRSLIRDTFPFVKFEPGFSNRDKLWQADHRESDRHLQKRALEALRAIMSAECQALPDVDGEGSERVLSVTSHSGFITNLLVTLGHPAIDLPTAGLVPLIITADCVDGTEPLISTSDQVVLQHG